MEQIHINEILNECGNKGLGAVTSTQDAFKDTWENVKRGG
jgi:hypothetical protein